MSSDVLDLGLLTVARAREMNRAAEIAELTGLSAASVRGRLNSARDETLVAALFESEWPARNEDSEVRGGMTAATARQVNLPAEIGKLTGLTESVVRQRLHEVNGNKRVWRVFAQEWPDLSCVASDVQFKSAGDSRNDQQHLATIAKVTRLSSAAVQLRLAASPGEALLGDVFAPEWPRDDLDENEDSRWLGRLRSSDARIENCAAMIAQDTGLSEAAVRARLESVPGQALVRNVFKLEWPRRSGARDNADKRPGGEPLVASSSATSTPKWPVGAAGRGQGGSIHRDLQEAIATLGVLRGDHAETDKHLTAGFRPDVVWFRIDPQGKPYPSPYHVFEIERGSHGARAKSIQSLQHAHERFNATVTLIADESSIEAIRQMIPARLSTHLKLRSISACLSHVNSPLELARVLEIELGTRR